MASYIYWNNWYCRVRLFFYRGKVWAGFWFLVVNATFVILGSFPNTLKDSRLKLFEVSNQGLKFSYTFPSEEEIVLAEEIPKNERSPEVYLVLSTANISKKKFTKAFEEIFAALKLKPADKKVEAALVNNKALISTKLGERVLAKELWENAIKLDPEYPMPYINIGNYFKDLKNFKKAEKYYLNGIELIPDDWGKNSSFAYLNLGKLYIDQKRYNKAEVALKQGIKINPKSFKSITELGNLFMDQQKNSQAIEKFKEALSINPNYRPAKLNLRLLSVGSRFFQNEIKSR